MIGIVLAVTLIATIIGASASINLYRHVKSTHSTEGGPSAAPHLWTMGWFVMIGLGAAAGYFERDHIHGLGIFIALLLSGLTGWETVKALRASYAADRRAHKRWVQWNHAGLLAVVLIGVMSGGCAKDSLHRCYESKVALANSLELMETMRDTGKLSQASVDSTKPYRMAAVAALNVWEKSAKSDPNTAAAAEQQFNAFKAIIDAVITSLTPAPATRPSAGNGAIYGPSHSGSGAVGRESDHRRDFYGFQGEPRYQRRGVAVG